MSDVVLTFDTDWAPDFVVRDTLELLGNTPATFFVTDEISAGLVKGIPTIEMGIHPNFLKKSSHGESYHEVLKTVLGFAPDAKIVRTHNLFQDTTVLDLFVEYNMQTDMSLLEYKNPRPKPFHYWNGLIRMPYNFEDDVACLRGEINSWFNCKDTMPTLVCDFHPIHVYLNSESLGSYMRLRERGTMLALKPSDIDPLVNQTSFGARDLLALLLDGVKANDHHLFSVTELIKKTGVEGWAEPVPTTLTTQRSTEQPKYWLSGSSHGIPHIWGCLFSV